MIRKHIPFLRLFILFGLLTPSSPTFASTVDLFGYGARGIALGGATATQARGHAAVYYNPAALTLAQTPSFAVGYQFANFSLEINESSHAVQDSPALVFGFGLPLPFGGSLRDRFSLGIGFVLPQGAILLARTPPPAHPSFPLLETRAQTLSAQLGLGVQIFDQFSIGVGAILLATLEGAIDAGPGPTGAVSAKVQDSLVAHFAPILGLLFTPTNQWSLAATWRGESLAEYSIPVTAELGSSIEIPIPTLQIEGVAQYDPQRASLEVSYTGFEHVLVAVGATLRMWSHFENPIEYPASPVDYPEQEAPAFHDTVTARIGVEYRVDWADWQFEPRVGYQFEPSPAPEQSGFHNYLSNHRHVFSVGFGVKHGDLTLDMAGQWHALVERTHVKEDSEEGPRTLNPGFPSITHGGNMAVFTTELGIAF